MTKPSPSPRHHRGFSLVELAIVLVVVSFLAGGLIVTLSAQMELANNSETQRRLADARQALIGYAAANGRLPCPAAPGTTGIEAPAVGGNCTNPWDGFLPGITLGLGPTNEAGYVLDAWGNPIRYAVTIYNNPTYCPTYCFTTTNGVKAVWNAVGGNVLVPNLLICNTAAGLTGSGDNAACATNTALATNAVAVVLSQGKNGGSPPTSADEVANTNADRLFISHTPTPAGANEFDDLVVWLSPNLLYSQMLAAGRLP